MLPQKLCHQLAYIAVNPVSHPTAQWKMCGKCECENSWQLAGI